MLTDMRFYTIETFQSKVMNVCHFVTGYPGDMVVLNIEACLIRSMSDSSSSSVSLDITLLLQQPKFLFLQHEGLLLFRL